MQGNASVTIIAHTHYSPVSFITHTELVRMSAFDEGAVLRLLIISTRDPPSILAESISIVIAN